MDGDSGACELQDGNRGRAAGRGQADSGQPDALLPDVPFADGGPFMAGDAGSNVGENQPTPPSTTTDPAPTPPPIPEPIPDVYGDGRLHGPDAEHPRGEGWDTCFAQGDRVLEVGPRDAEHPMPTRGEQFLYTTPSTTSDESEAASNRQARHDPQAIFYWRERPPPQGIVVRCRPSFGKGSRQYVLVYETDRDLARQPTTSQLPQLTVG